MHKNLTKPSLNFYLILVPARGVRPKLDFRFLLGWLRWQLFTKDCYSNSFGGRGYLHPRNLKNGLLYSFLHYFWGQHCRWTKTCIIGNDSFCFFQVLITLSSNLLLPSCCSSIPGKKDKIVHCGLLFCTWCQCEREAFRNSNCFRWNCCNI